MGAFDQLEWTYSGAFGQLFGLVRGEFEQKFSKNSKARGGGVFKLRFDWYISINIPDTLAGRRSLINRRLEEILEIGSCRKD